MELKKQLPTGHHWMKKYLRYFSTSLKRFPDKYISLVFRGQPVDNDYHVYLCPICLTNCLAVDRSGYYESSEFTEDHFPPDCVDGRLTVLVCKNCNNTAGGKFENSLVQKMEQVSFDKKVPNSILRTKVVFDDVKGWRHGQLNVSDSMELFLQLKITKNESLPELSREQNDTNNHGKGWKANVSPQPFSHEKLTKALLKTAYLYSFYNWGYDFIFSQSGELVRNALTGKADYPIDVGELWFDFNTPVTSGHVIPEGLCFLYKPEELRIFMINIPMTLITNGYKCIVPVLIPSPAMTSIEDMMRVQSVFKKNPNQNIVIYPVNNALLHGISDCYQRTWDDLIKQRN